MIDIRTADDIYSEMKKLFAEKTGVSLRQDADMSIRMQALAHEAGTLWTHADWLLRQCFPQTASGGYLEYHAQLRGIKRTDAATATGVIRFLIASARQDALVIQKGMVCIAAGGIEFITTQTGIIAPGALYCDVNARAVQPGASGNVQADCVLYMSNPPVGVQACRNPDAFSGGADTESDEGLRERVLNSYRSLPNGANAAYYEAQALSVEGVCAVSVLPKRRGLGTVDIIISSENGTPPQSLVNDVQALLEMQREICVSIEVDVPNEVAVNVAAVIGTAEGHMEEEVENEVRNALQAFFCGRLLGRNVLLAELGSVIFKVDGVANYKILSPATDIPIGEDELPVLGSLSIDKME